MSKTTQKCKGHLRRYRVTLEVIVTDPSLAIKTARDRVQDSGGRRGDIAALGDAVHWLADPGSQPDEGWEIEESTCEEVRLPWLCT